MATSGNDGRCPVGRAFGKLNPQQQRDMQAILDNGIASHHIVVWFSRYRHTELSTNSVTVHRSKRCTCFKDQPDGDS